MKFFIIVAIFFVTLQANDNLNKFKNCEVVTLAELTDIVSCSKIDYLIEYKQNDEYKRGEVKKVTVVTDKNTKVIKE